MMTLILTEMEFETIFYTKMEVFSAVRWQLRGRRENAYLFEYDNKYQLLKADFL